MKLLSERFTPELKHFLRRALIPYRKNPGLNLDAVMVITGLSVWSICSIGRAFGWASDMPDVQQIASMIFGVGIGRASKVQMGDMTVESKK